MKIIRHISLIIMFSIIVSGCAVTGATPGQQRANILKMKNDTLNKLYKLKPQVKNMIRTAPGYAVFNNGNVNVIFASFGGGRGVVKNNLTGRHTYMKMAEVGIGLGLGVKDFSAVFVFHDKKTMYKFINEGWQFGGHADAAAKSKNDGGAIAGEMLVDNISIFQLTNAGLALQATIKGNKYWKDDSLN